MPGPPWGEDPQGETGLISSKVAVLVHDLASAAALRVPPELSLAHDWHTRIYQGISSVPRRNYLGAFRGGSDPDLHDYDVVIADSFGRVVAQTPSAGEVATHLARLQNSLRSAITALDTRIPVRSSPADVGEVEAVVLLAASIHGEWVKIHPYANGNGRIARLWANWVAMRYGLPPFVRIKPRPDGLLYPRAAADSMARPPSWVGNHQTTYSLFLSLLAQPTNP